MYIRKKKRERESERESSNVMYQCVIIRNKNIRKRPRTLRLYGTRI